MSNRADASLQDGTWTPTTSIAPTNDAVISAVPTVVKNLLITNTHAANTYYVMIFDVAAIPVAPGSYPRLSCFPITPLTTLRIPVGRLRLTTGLTWASSSTAGSLTLSGDESIQVQAELLTSR